MWLGERRVCVHVFVRKEGGYACGWEKRVCVCMWLGEEGMCMHVVG